MHLHLSQGNHSLAISLRLCGIKNKPQSCKENFGEMQLYLTQGNHSLAISLRLGG
jgi:hypothetical protein